MLTSCCAPQCKPTGFYNANRGNSVVFLLSKLTFTKKAVDSRHSPRRGKNFKISPSASKVCSLHFRPEDLRKSLSGRIYVADGAIQSKFAWSIPSPHLLFASH